MRFAGAGDAYLRQSATHCSFDGLECWNVRVHPVIESINAATGYTTGGQELQITGWGLSGEAEVTVDGVSCQVTATTDTGITCRTSASVASTDGYQPGQPGLR